VSGTRDGAIDGGAGSIIKEDQLSQPQGNQYSREVSEEANGTHSGTSICNSGIPTTSLDYASPDP